MAVDEETGEVEWATEALKKGLSLPYLKSINSLEPRFPALYEAVQQLHPGDNRLLKLKLKLSNGTS